jgi:hypothetical protein
VKRWLGFFLACAAVAACSAASDSNEFEGAGGSGSGSSSATSAGTFSSGASMFDAGSSSGGGGPGCSEEAKLVYVVGDGNELYSFYPPTLDLKQVGIINCPEAGFATPFSMAVDRSGTAWVVFSDGRIHHVDVSNAACTSSNFQAGQQGFVTFGMGFVSDTPGSDAETLYVADYLGAGLGKINTGTLILDFVGAYDLKPGLAAELTGTGDARLFGFYNETPIVIAEIDKTNAAILSEAPQPSVSIGSGWAFAFWGGDFWLFTSPTGDSQIDRYQPGNGTTTTVKTNIGANIVGAGVSTCAPVEPPT